MQKPPLPPLNAIKAFDAAGRHGSFKAAAEEMNVTPGAISRQIALLEAHVGQALFERHHREVSLTPQARQYLADVRDALDRLRASTEALRQSGDERLLNLWCPMTFGLRWLAPRLPTFRAQNPGREVAITTSLSVVEVELPRTDIAIRIGRGHWPGMTCHRLVGIELTPVCSPRLLQALGRPLTLEDLRSQTLLQSAARPQYWSYWLDAVGAMGIDPTRGTIVESVSLAYQLAAEGAGVAMGQFALVEADLASGRLVMPFDRIVPIDDAFYVLHAPGAIAKPYVRAFSEWVLAEGARSEQARCETRSLPARRARIRRQAASA